MVEAVNNLITGTWSAVTLGAGIATGQAINFNGTITSIGQTFTAISYGLNGGLNVVPGVATGGGGYFTFNGDLNDFAGLSLGAELSAGVTAGYSMTVGPGGGESLVMTGAQGELGFSVGLAYTDVIRDGAGWIEDLMNLINPRPTDPLVIDLDGDGVELISRANANAYFDLDGDGFAEQTGWVKPDDGLLAVDRNGNGAIDDISELFGSATQSGFDALRAFDTNNDGKVNSQDSGFGTLKTWRDLNGDGISDAGELQA